MARGTGTRSLGPSASGNTSGGVSTGNGGSISITNGGLSTNSNVTITSPNGGNINLVTSSTNRVTISSDRNVGSYDNALGKSYVNGQLQLDSGSVLIIDGYNGVPPAFSSTAERERAGTYFVGGVGIEQDLSVGGFIYGRISAANTATTSSQLIVLSTDTNADFYITFTEVLNSSGRPLYGDNTSTFHSSSTSTGLTYNPYYGKITTDRVQVAATDTSVSTTTGALVVDGGAGIAGDLTIGGVVYSENNFTDSYLENIYSKFLGSDNTQSTLALGAGTTDVFGDIRVRGSNPIGTAPVVTNVLYVTVDGNDTNDGRAMDPSRACRTISGAIKSPYYQSGTQIQVSAGRYLENNPILLKPYTSVKGSDIRTTFIEPINKTQDLFHVQSGCYINYMTFLNGRSGLLEGPYANGYNRGAYATAFPPLEGNERIDLFHSPYIQNVTNQSGPWLKDGTMFVPDQTVQVPAAVGTGSWPAGTATITISLSTGSIAIGQSINAGPQNPGFFNARTLLLANKPFLQSQVVAWIKQQIDTATDPANIWYNFSYNQQLCYRDTGILVENMAYDMAFGGNQKSVESGKAYYKGVTSVIAGQEAQTTAAIEYLAGICQQVAVNTTVATYAVPIGIPSGTQVINTVLTGGEIATASIQKLFNITTDIINRGPDIAPQLYNSPGPDAAFVSAEILLQANRAFIQENVINYINYNLCFPPKTLAYNQIKCRRDSKIIVDSIASDLLFSTSSQSTFAGLQYYNQNQYTGSIPSEITATIVAVSYLKDLSIKVVQNITTATDALVGVTRYTDGIQITSPNYASPEEVATIKNEFDIILSILKGKTAGLTDLVVPNGTASVLPSVRNTVDLLIANKNYLADEIVASVVANNPSLTFNQSTCARDVGYIIQSVAFDLLYGGNRQAIQSGLSYYANTNNATVIPRQTDATVDAFTFIGTLSRNLITGNTYTPLQAVIKPVLGLPVGTSADADAVDASIGIINNIILDGPTVAGPLYPMPLDPLDNTTTANAWTILKSNRDFIAAEVIAYLDQKYNPDAFNYNQESCYRDTGLIVDAVSQDILLGGNEKSLEAGNAYWNSGYNYVAGQITTTTLAINYAKDLALQVIANTPVTSVTGTVATQVINPFFDGGGAYMPQEAIRRNFKIITDVISDGPQSAPAQYAGGGLFSLTGLNGSDVRVAPTVTAINTTTVPGTYEIGLSTTTVGFGNNATLYIGDTHIFPLQDFQVEDQSRRSTGDASTWNQRKVDPFGSMGGSLVDGAVISDRSPIQSFVYDAYTQVNQGGYGVHITNNGYAQLVSVFTIFCSVGVRCDNGGKASIVNSNANFGDLCLVASGYGKREFSGTIFNPANRAYPFSPQGLDQDGNTLPYLDQFYPGGYWPGNGGQVEVFVPDLANRPHIGQVMEIVPPQMVYDAASQTMVAQKNEQGFAGFLNAQPSTGTLTTGTIELKNISTTDVYVGNTVHIRDQYGREYDDNGAWYVQTGTVVTDVGYNSITLNHALTSGGGDPINPDYFTIYFCGNSYYTVQTSTPVPSSSFPYRANQNILSAYNDSPAYYQGPAVDQIDAHKAAINYLKICVGQVIANQPISNQLSAGTQTIIPTVTNGDQSRPFTDLRFNYIVEIIGAADIASAESVVPPRLITTSGTVPNGAGSAVTLINANLDFLAGEVVAFVNQLYLTAFDGSLNDNQKYKCERDVRLILQQIIYDLESGGNYNSVNSGLSYWARVGTYWVVELGEAVTRTDLFPDGSTVNFYQRSYISASGYVFEYVGAGSNYGALPQRGIADPVQNKETVSLNSGKVFFTSTDQNGDFRIGTGLVISQATGVLSGRTFVQSLYANMTPFILAIE